MAVWPTDAEINAFLVAAGITLTSSLSGLSEAAQQAFEMDTHCQPFLAEDGLRKFDPPHSHILLLDNYLSDLYLVTLSDVEVVEETDFWQYPANKDTKLWLKFNYPLYGVSQSIEISGSWGYSKELPADVYEACLRKGAILGYNLYQQGVVTRLTQDDVTVQYGNSSAEFTQFGQWDASYQNVVQRYALRSV